MAKRKRRGRTQVLGREVSVEISPSDSWEVLVGSARLTLDREAAEDLCNTLTIALHRAGADLADRLLVLEAVEDQRRQN